MRFLVDTHVLLWWLDDDPRLSPDARQRIADSDSDVVVSAVSVAEIAIKSSVGKLEIPGDLLDQITLNDFTVLPLQATHAKAVAALPLHHRDPFDRLILAQAVTEEVPLMTADPAFDQYDARLMRAAV